MTNQEFKRYEADYSLIHIDRPPQGSSSLMFKIKLNRIVKVLQARKVWRTMTLLIQK